MARNDFMRMLVAKNYMRVHLSPRLGGTHSGQSTPHYCPPLIHLHPPGTV